jgi:hypothetical protein
VLYRAWFSIGALEWDEPVELSRPAEKGHVVRDAQGRSFGVTMMRYPPTLGYDGEFEAVLVRDDE